MKIEDGIFEEMTLGDRPEDIDRVRNTKSISSLSLTPGEISQDGSWIDTYGYKHYSHGGKYKYAENDKRLTANGAFSGKHKTVGFTEEEIEENPTLALKPKDYQTVLLYMKGLSRRQIAKTLEVSEQTVTTRLSKPSVKGFLAQQKDVWTEDIHALTESAIDVLRDAMDKDVEMHHRLMGADKVLRANERLGSTKPTAKEETATSQLQQVLNKLDITVNVNN